MNKHEISDKIEQVVFLRATQPRVWQALTDHQKFGQWFQVTMKSPFLPGTVSKGRVIHPPEFDYVVFEMRIERVVAESYFSYRWHPCPIDRHRDYSLEPTTLVEFELEAAGEGTQLLLRESGFNRVPQDRREEAFLANRDGWKIQFKNIEDYLAVGD